MHNVLKYFFLFFCTINLPDGFAQNISIDSLKLALKNAKHDTSRCNILNELVEAEANDNIWPLFNEELRLIAEKNIAVNNTNKLFYLKHLANALNNVGYLAEHLGDIPKALEFYHKSLKIEEEIKDKKGIATALSNIGTIYHDQGDMQKTLEYHFRSLKIREEIRDTQGIAYSLQNIGATYNRMGDMDKALDHYQKSLKLAELIKDKYGIANALFTIGSVYKYHKDIKTALEYYNRSLKIEEEIQDKRGIANSLNTIACLFLEQGQFTEAFANADKSLQIAKELGYPENIRFSAGTLKSIYQKQNKFKEAFEMYEIEIKMRDSLNNQETQKASVKKQIQYEYDKKELQLKAEQEKKDLITSADLKQKEKERNYFIAGFGLVIILALFILNGYRQKRRDNKLIVMQKHLVEEKQKEIIDSIHYAKKIQTALMTNEKYIQKTLTKLQNK